MTATLTKRVGIRSLDTIFRTTQLITYPFNWWLSRRIKLTARVPYTFSVPRGTLVLANHRSLFDPFLIAYHLGMENWLHTIPTRYPATPDYTLRPILGSVIRALGAYNIGRTPMERAKKLVFTRDLLDRGCTVLLFPEGKIVDNGEVVAEFQRGIKMLFAQDYPIVLVRLSGFNTHSFLRPHTVADARIEYSPVIRGTPEMKLEQLRTFYGLRDV
ncbi:MAG: lysophospholipid acyltransferase family protein [Patescibacteria group bacterium]